MIFFENISVDPQEVVSVHKAPDGDIVLSLFNGGFKVLKGVTVEEVTERLKDLRKVGGTWVRRSEVKAIRVRVSLLCEILIGYEWVSCGCSRDEAAKELGL